MDPYPPADLLFVNGEVLTLDDAGRTAEAVAVRGGRIAAVGGREEARARLGPRTTVVDLKGRTLLPGFIDAHLHLLDAGLAAAGLDLSWPAVRSIDQILERVREAASRTPPGAWIRGWGYDQSRLKEGRHPTRWELDRAAPRHPVVLNRVCGHIGAHNSAALAACRVDRHTPDPPGGAIERRDGEPTGVLVENAYYQAMALAPFSDGELRGAVAAADRSFVSRGLTSVHDAGGYGRRQAALLQEEAEAGRLRVRVNAMVLSYADNRAFQEALLASGLRTGFGDERLRLGAFKVGFVDGSSSAPTAAVREPYLSLPGYRGMLNLEPGELEAAWAGAHGRGWQVTAHAVGDRAVELVLAAAASAQQGCPREGARHRIEHCALVDGELVRRIGELGMVPVLQPAFLPHFGDGYLRNFGPQRASLLFAARAFLQAGIPAAGSSDCPVTPADPLAGIRAAVLRTTADGQPIGPAQRVGVPEALRMFTRNGAYAAFEERLKGSIEEGKLADLTVLSGPLSRTPPERLGDLAVEMTVIGGRIVWEA